MFGATSFGALWQPISIGVIVGGVGFTFGKLFRMDASSYIPFFCISLILWNFFVNSINELSALFRNPGEFQQHQYNKLLMFPMKVISKNIFQLVLNLSIFVITALFFQLSFTITNALVSTLGLLLFLLIVYLLGILASLIGSRFSDFPNVILNFLQIMFYLTPVMWKPEIMPHKWLYEYNPIYYLLHLVRGPILDGQANFQLYIFAVSLVFALFVLAVTFWSIFAWRINYHTR